MEGKTKKRSLKKSIRVIFYIAFFIVFLIVGMNFVLKSFDVENEKVINYKEQSNLDYKVYLKKNNFYEEKYLGKDMVYIASLIDNIKLHLNYNFDIDEIYNIDFTYDVVGKIVISDENGKNSYFEKTYTLKDSKDLKMISNNHFNISDDIDINYNYYNNLANKFKAEYGINPTSNLIVYFRINKQDSNYSENVIHKSNSIMSITIPLSEKSVNIKMNYKDINEKSEVVNKSDVFMKNIISFVIGVVATIIAIVFMIKSMRILKLSGKKKSAYDKYIKKLLREYDRLIVETATAPMLEEKRIIEIEKFSELLDVRDSIKQPIMYYIIQEHEKSYFYIDYEDKLYLNVTRKEDLEKNKIDK